MQRLPSLLAQASVLAALLTVPASPARGTDAALISALKAKGVDVTETKGEISGVTLKKGAVLTEADYRQIRQIPHLKSLSCAAGFDDAALKALAGLPELEAMAFNGVSLSDDGARTLATFRNLHNFAFFHPTKGFKGTGLAALADLPDLERLTVAGSLEFGDEGMATVAKITHLKEFRTWHSGVTTEGVKHLQALKELKTLTIGQRLAAKPPTTLNDETLAALAEIPSLESLTLQEARLSLPALGKLKQLAHLKRLTLDKIEITEADVASLRQQLPHTDVKWTALDEAAKKRIKNLFDGQ